MHTWSASGLMGRAVRTSATASSRKHLQRAVALALILAALAFVLPTAAHALAPSSAAAVVQEHAATKPASEAGGEANLRLPDMGSVKFLNDSITGSKLLEIGLIFCALGGLFGLIIYMQLKGAAVHRAMREISELIYETCKTYLVTQGKFILLLWAFIAVIIAVYFGWLAPIAGKPITVTLPIIWLLASSGSPAATAWPGSAFA